MIARAALRCANRRLSTALNISRGGDGGPFAFSEASEKEIAHILARYPPQHLRAAVIPVLHVAQAQNGGWTSRAAMDAVAARLGLPAMRVYEVATFYTMFRREGPRGKHLLQVCTTTPCQLCGATAVWNALVAELGLGGPKAQPGDTRKEEYTVPQQPAVRSCMPADGEPAATAKDTTDDGLFTLEQVECSGACVNAPVLAIDGEYYEDVSPRDAVRLVRALRENTALPAPGPVGAHRSSCEPLGGPTTLRAKIDPFSLFRSDL